MKTIVIKNMKNFSLVAIMMAAIVFAACSGEEYIISTQPTTGTFTLTVNASKGDDSATRALSLDGDALKATWKEGDVVTVYNVTRSAELTGSLIAQDDGKSTKLRGTLTGTIAVDDELKLKFLSPTYSSQDGTLAGIASTCDYAEATVSVKTVSGSSITTDAATFTNQQSIVEFTLKDKATDAALNAKKLTVNAGATTINVTPASATDVLYVAIPSISSQNISLSATVSGTGYTYEKSGVTLDNGKYYGFTVSMDENPLSQALTFEAKEAGTTITFTKGTAVTNQIEYSTDDGNTWTTYSTSISLAKIGDKVSFRGNNAVYGTSLGYECSNFYCSKVCYVYGNVMSLIDPTNYATATVLTEDYAFSHLFSSSKICNHPTKKIKLPATTLTRYCYDSMFYTCTNLTEAPELPATTLADYCYNQMFFNCWNFAIAPELPATTLADYCYRYMFSACWQMDTPPELPATILTKHCYSAMFYDCRKLKTAPVLPATIMTEQCYSGMFYNCISLTTPPELPSTSLADHCYSGMFDGCSKLTTAPSLPATTLADYCYTGMFQYCRKLTVAPELPATTLSERCYWRMFQGCTSLITPPELSATTLTEYCYAEMFSDCTKLNNIKCLATDISASYCTMNWLKDVPSSGTFTKASSMTSWPSGANGIPSGWKVENVE